MEAAAAFPAVDANHVANVIRSARAVELAEAADVTKVAEGAKSAEAVCVGAAIVAAQATEAVDAAEAAKAAEAADDAPHRRRRGKNRPGYRHRRTEARKRLFWALKELVPGFHSMPHCPFNNEADTMNMLYLGCLACFKCRDMAQQAASVVWGDVPVEGCQDGQV